jgi:hypothetical protein
MLISRRELAALILYSQDFSDARLQTDAAYSHHFDVDPSRVVTEEASRGRSRAKSDVEALAARLTHTV